MTRDPERGHAALAPNRLGQAQRQRLSVVVVGQEPGDDLDTNTLEPVSIQQGAGGGGPRHAGVVRDAAVAPEGRPDEPLDREAENERHEQEQPDRRGHGRTLSPASQGLDIRMHSACAS